MGEASDVRADAGTRSPALRRLRRRRRQASVGGAVGGIAALVAGLVAGTIGRPPTATHPPTPSGVVAVILASAPDNDVSASQFCTGVLVAADRVVTAAHCVTDKRADGVDVILDADNLCSPDPIDGERVHVEAIEPFASGADAALLRLESASAGHSPTKLYGGDPREGDVLEAWGWSSSSIGGATSCEVTARSLVTVPLDRCALELDAEFADASAPAPTRNPTPAPGRHLAPTPSPASALAPAAEADYLCAVPTGTRNTCLGDSGGPLMLHGRHELAGITLSGRGCGASDPGLYLAAAAISRELAGR